MTEDAAAREYAQYHRLSMATVRVQLDELEARGVFLVYREPTDEWCPACMARKATEPSGFCIKCDTEREKRRQLERDEDEREELARERTTKLNAVKKRRERMRERFLANPRDKDAKEVLAAVDYFIEFMEEEVNAAAHEDDPANWWE